ncbi:MAG: PEP-CTERM sorting domain-containing protein [Desulfobacteraceae bacterium]|nr:PEP-CTERM sorting domain-containing protein [Desulfobacteraceae bacterium]
MKKIAIVLILIFSFGISSEAAPIYYTDFGIFDDLTTTAIVEDFESITPKDTALKSFSNNGNTYTGISSSPLAPNVWVSSPGYKNYGVPITDTSILTATGDENFIVDFGDPTKVLGFDTYLNEYGPATIQIFGTDGLIDTYTLNHDPTQIGFWGVISDEFISSVQWTSPSGSLVNTGIDNIRQGEAVPEPSTILLMIIGLLGIIGANKKLTNK